MGFDFGEIRRVREGLDEKLREKERKSRDG